MAKLNGVKTLAETIVYGGVTYVKTDEAPKAGDIVRANEAKLDVTAGAYYVVKAGEGESYDGPVHFVDDSGDRRSQQLCDSEYSGNYTVFRRQETTSTPADDIVTVDGVRYRKVTPKPASTRLAVGDYAKVVAKESGSMVGINVGDIVKVIEVRDEPRRNRYALTDAATEKWWGAALESDIVRATDAEVAAAKRPNVKVGDTDATEDRRARAGDFKAGDIARIVSITSRAAAGFNVGDVVNVLNYESCGNYTLHIGKDDGRRGYVDACDLERVSTTETPKTSTERLKVGEYARVVADGKDVTNGDIVRIDEDDETDIPFKGVKVNGDNDEWDWFTSDQLERIDAETAKWAAIGRKVGEIKNGDIVRVLYDHPKGAVLVTGDIGIVSDWNPGDFRVNTSDKTSSNWVHAADVELLAPVETLFSA